MKANYPLRPTYNGAIINSSEDRLLLLIVAFCTKQRHAHKTTHALLARVGAATNSTTEPTKMPHNNFI
jgi:hypothetical protein